MRQISEVPDDREWLLLQDGTWVRSEGVRGAPFWRTSYDGFGPLPYRPDGATPCPEAVLELCVPAEEVGAWLCAI